MLRIDFLVGIDSAPHIAGPRKERHNGPPARAPARPAALVEPVGQLLRVLVAGVRVGEQRERRVLADVIAGAAVRALEDVGADRIEDLALRHDRVDRQGLDLDAPARLLLDVLGEALEGLLVDGVGLPVRLPLPLVFGGAGRGPERRDGGEDDGRAEKLAPLACQHDVHSLCLLVSWLPAPRLSAGRGPCRDRGSRAWRSETILCCAIAAGSRSALGGVSCSK